jgi:hypothetical protein
MAHDSPEYHERYRLGESESVWAASIEGARGQRTPQSRIERPYFDRVLLYALAIHGFKMSASNRQFESCGVVLVGKSTNRRTKHSALA